MTSQKEHHQQNSDELSRSLGYKHNENEDLRDRLERAEANLEYANDRGNRLLAKVKAYEKEREEVEILVENREREVSQLVTKALEIIAEKVARRDEISGEGESAQDMATMALEELKKSLLSNQESTDLS